MKMHRGFTLPEVLATMVLLGIILPPAMWGLTSAMQASAQARHMAESAELAQLKLSEIALLNDSTRFTGTGDFGAQWPEYRWESSFSTGDFGVYLVTVRVMWQVRNEQRSTALTTILKTASTTVETSSGGVQ